MQINQQNESQFQQNKQQIDIYSYPLPVRIKHASWSVRKGTYEQILYLLQNLSNANQQMLISGNQYTIQTLLPYFQNLIQQKHAMVLLKGLECVEQILILDKKAASKHCIKSLADKGIQYFPLLSQQRKAILQKFLDILQMSKIDGNFLKNKLNLPHQKSVMYVIQVIGVLGITSLKSTLINLNKKHQKKCVRELALQIAEELQDSETKNTVQNQQSQQGKAKTNKNHSVKITNNKTSGNSSGLNIKITIQKLPHYEQLNSKQQQSYSGQILQKIEVIIQEYSLAQLPNFSHFIRLMIDDNNHIININAIKCLIAIFNQEKQDRFNKGSLIPISFPLLFIFSKFKSHKTHPINALLLHLAETIVQSSSNRASDLFLAISEGLSSAGSKANVKFGCSLTFFRVVALLHQNQDLYNCTTNQNAQSENEDLQQKFNNFKGITISKNIQKIIQKTMVTLEKDKKYETQMYLIKHAIGLDGNALIKVNSANELIVKNNKSVNFKQSSEQKPKVKTTKIQEQDKFKKTSMQHGSQKNLQEKNNKQHQFKTNSLSKTLKNAKSLQQFKQINLQKTLNQILKHLNSHNEYQQKRPNFQIINSLLQKSSQQFYQSVREKRYEMFYLCQLLDNFITRYQPDDLTIQSVSQFLINILKIISLLKATNTPSQKSSSPLLNQFKQVSLHNVSQLLQVALCKLVISEDIQQILENLNQNYSFDIVLESLEKLFVISNTNKIKKKNKRFLLDWLQSNTPALYINNDYYTLIEKIKQKQGKAKQTLKQEKLKSENFNKQHGNRLHHQQNIQRSPIAKKKNIQYIQIPSYRKQNPISEELQNINLSKIQQKYAQSQYFGDYDEKSSFQANLEQHLQQISTQRSEDQDFQRKQQKHDISRQYLKKLELDHKTFEAEKFKKKKQDDNMILQSSQFKEDHEKSYDYDQKCQQVQNRRLERERQRKQFMNRMKSEFKPMPSKNKKKQFDQSQEQSGEQKSQDQHQLRKQLDIKSISDINQQSQKKRIAEKPQNQFNQSEFYEQKQDQYITENNDYFYRLDKKIPEEVREVISVQKDNFIKQDKQKASIQQQSLKIVQNTQQSGSNPAKINNKNNLDISDCSFVSSTQSGQFRYRLLNSQKMSYMLKTTTNPYPHLRTLILIPFKSSNKKHQFLKQLLHFYSNHIEFKIPQPYNSIVLLTILLFSEIKQDKTLIQPLQALYEFVAKQSTTNQFVKTIINLFHSVIEQTLAQNRKFLITILLKSMIRMLPFIEDGVSLLRDIQQFYQIGEMVYFQMFQDEYFQIKQYIEEEAIHLIVEKALQQEGDNLISIVEGWLTTGFKKHVLHTIQQFKNQEYEDNNQQNQQNCQQDHQQDQQHQQQNHQKQNRKYDSQKNHNYNSYI